MSQQSQSASTSVSNASLTQAIAQLAREASVEINVQDVKHLEASKAFLTPGKRIYVSHLPKQTWEETEAACRAVRAVGYDPIPHIPARLIADANTLDRALTGFVQHAQIQEALLIAGDYPEAAGPFSNVSEVLRTQLLLKHGLKRVSLAGHPEGHPKVDLQEVRRAEVEKTAIAAEQGLDAALVTQFFFEHQPFLDWVAQTRAKGVKARIVGGLAGPASLTTLFRFAMRCGAGPSIRALGARPTSLMKLIGDRGPEDVLRGMAEARLRGEADFTGIHMFCFGGFLRTCEWLHAVGNSRFKLDDKGSFSISN